ncbi:MAG: hypothetical protein U9R68_00730 [Planctomycetota bacterium]|nr:hypothetical protein [Planctomycetota bacterium]
MSPRTRRSVAASGRRLGPGRQSLLGRFHRCERAQVVFVVVLFFFLLAGLVFLILNSGQKLNHKVQMQHAADSVAATGAAWYARGLNVIAMCNVADTQLLSLIVLLDTLETVVPPAQECINDLCSNLGGSKAGHDMLIDGRISEWLAVGNARDEQQIIQQLGQIVAEVNWPEYLQYDNGVLWECTKLMDGFMHAMREVTPLVAQREAIDIADENGAEFGFVLPLWPVLPVRDGRFRDFENPMRTGRMPPPRERQVIGGFAHVMHYRGYYPDYMYRGEIHHGHGPVMGPWSYWREPFTATRPMGLLDLSRFSVLFNLVSSKKLEMMFGETDDRVSLRNWEMRYDVAKGLDPDDVRRAWWDHVSFDARYEFPEPSFFNNIDLRHHHRPVVRTRAFGSMEHPSLAGYTRATLNYEGTCPREAVFYRVKERTTAHYPQLGIFAPHPPIHADGSRWPYTEAEKQIYYHMDLWRFNGAELKDTDESLHRRYLPPAGGEPCAPILFDRTEGDRTWDTINTYFTFNGFAYVPGGVKEWGAKFGNPNPIDKLIGYAQARVYGRYSWDLFTQHWKVKLMRTDRWKHLLTELQGGVPAGGGEVADALTQERLEPVARLIQYYDEAFVQEFTH